MQEDRVQENGDDKRGWVRLETEGRPRTGGASSSDPGGREDGQVEKWLQAGVIIPDLLACTAKGMESVGKVGDCL